MNKKAIAILAIMVVLFLLCLGYQNKLLKDTRNVAVGRYTASVYHLQRVNDIMLEKMVSGQIDKVEIQGYANRSIDLGILSADIGIPTQNYYNRLASGFEELANLDPQQMVNKEKLTQELIFLLESLKEVYGLIFDEVEGDFQTAYKRIFVNGEITIKASEYLALQERTFYEVQ